MAGAQLSPDLASLCYILPFGQIRRTRPPSLVPNPVPAARVSGTALPTLLARLRCPAPPAASVIPSCSGCARRPHGTYLNLWVAQPHRCTARPNAPGFACSSARHLPHGRGRVH